MRVTSCGNRASGKKAFKSWASLCSCKFLTLGKPTIKLHTNSMSSPGNGNDLLDKFLEAVRKGDCPPTRPHASCPAYRRMRSITWGLPLSGQPVRAETVICRAVQEGRPAHEVELAGRVALGKFSQWWATTIWERRSTCPMAGLDSVWNKRMSVVM